MKFFVNKNKGFTLVEIIVSISVFAVVMLISSSSIYGVFDSNRKSQSLRSVMDNLNFSLEAMTRTIRFGSVYHCDILIGSTSSNRDCNGGATPAGQSIAVRDSNGNTVFYKLSNGRIARSINSGADQYVTSSDVVITRLDFYVLGSTPYSTGSDVLQPRVIVVVGGYSGSKTSSRTTFNLQTTVSQRQLDSI